MTSLFDDALQALKDTKQFLLDEITMHDRKIVDIQHLLEFADFNDAEILQTSTQLIATLRNRRECKNRLDILQAIKRRMSKPIYYAPRILADSFEKHREKLSVRLSAYEVPDDEIYEGSVFGDTGNSRQNNCF